MMRQLSLALVAITLLLMGCNGQANLGQEPENTALLLEIGELGNEQATPLLALLASETASTPVDSIVRWVAAVRKGGTSLPAGRVLSRLLAENHPIYQERGNREARRLRTYLLASLKDTGTPVEATPYLLAELRYYHPRDLRTIAAAARAAGGLPYLDSTLVASLTPYLREDFPDEEFDLDEYAPEYPYASPTSLKREILHLLATGSLDGKIALPALAETQEPGPGSIYSRYPELQQTALIATNRIKADTATYYPDLRHLFAPDAMAPQERTKRSWPSPAIQDQYGQPFTFAHLVGKPFALTFYYSSCRNFNKCSMTVSRFRRLEQAVRAAGLEEQVALCALSLDPAYDVPARNMEYFTTRGERVPAPFAHILTVEEAELPDLLSGLDVGVSYGSGEVALHGIEMLLFDREGRLAHRYRNIHWDNDQVVKDLGELTREGSGFFAR